MHASLAEAIHLFPPYLSGAVKRIPDTVNENALVAAIAMTFPAAQATKRFGCHMTLDITENKVEHIARELFHAHLETTEGLRYVCLPGGAKVLPNPHFTLRGCRHEIILPIFGPETSGAIMASPVYREEFRQGRNCTDCVSMVISHGAHDGGSIIVTLGLREGALLKDKLYH